MAMSKYRSKRAIIPAWALERLVQLPAGATIRAMHYSAETNSLHLAIDHPTFPEVPEGGPLPLLAPIAFKAIDGGMRVAWGFGGEVTLGQEMATGGDT